MVIKAREGESRDEKAKAALRRREPHVHPISRRRRECAMVGESAEMIWSHYSMSSISKVKFKGHSWGSFGGKN